MLAFRKYFALVCKSHAKNEFFTSYYVKKELLIINNQYNTH